MFFFSGGGGGGALFFLFNQSATKPKPMVTWLKERWSGLNYSTKVTKTAKFVLFVRLRNIKASVSQ